MDAHHRSGWRKTLQLLKKDCIYSLHVYVVKNILKTNLLYIVTEYEAEKFELEINDQKEQSDAKFEIFWQLPSQTNLSATRLEN